MGLANSEGAAEGAKKPDDVEGENLLNCGDNNWVRLEKLRRGAPQFRSSICSAGEDISLDPGCAAKLIKFFKSVSRDVFSESMHKNLYRVLGSPYPINWTHPLLSKYNNPFFLSWGEQKIDFVRVPGANMLMVFQVTINESTDSLELLTMPWDYYEQVLTPDPEAEITSSRRQRLKNF